MRHHGTSTSSFALLGLLVSAGLTLTAASARADETAPATQPAAGPRVKIVDGIVQPRTPIADSLRRAMLFLRRSDGQYVPGRIDGDLAGYFHTCLVQSNGERDPSVVAYPARHHAYFILTFLRYHEYTGDAEWLLRARDLADWEIAHSTPADSHCPYLAYSTMVNDKPGGGPDKNAIEPDKSAFIGAAYLAVHQATGDKRYLDAAKRVADSLVRLQRKDGGWAFRIVPEDGSVLQDFGGAPVFFVTFFEDLLAVDDKPEYRRACDAALAYMLKTNVEQEEWGTYHEDVPPVKKSYSAAEQTCFTAAYLLDHARQRPEYLPMAMKVLHHIEERFVHKSEHPMSPAPAVAEQPGCNHIMPGHTARYCATLARLYGLTHDDKHRRAVLSGLAGTTYMQNEYGLFRTWVWDVNNKAERGGEDWYSQHLYTVYHMLESLGMLPELAPADEDHLLGSSVRVREIAYTPGRVTFATALPAVAVLRLRFEPASVTLDGRALPRKDALPLAADGWHFDAAHGVLTVRHGAGKVAIGDR